MSEEKIASLTIDGSGAVNALDQIEQKFTKLGDATESNARRLTSFGRDFQSIARSMGVYTDAWERVKRVQEAAARAVDSGRISQEQANRVIEEAKVKYDENARAARDAAKAVEQAAQDQARATAATAQSLEAVRRQYDSGYAALAKYGDELARVTQILDAADVTEAERVRTLKALAGALDPIARAERSLAEEAARSVEVQAQAQAELANELDRVRARYNASYAEVKRYVEETNRVTRILEQANVAEEERIRILAEVEAAHDPVIKAEREREAAETRARDAVEKTNRELVERERALQRAADAQAEFNARLERFGVHQVGAKPANPAAASGAVFEDAAREEQDLQRLIGGLDRTHGATERLAQQQALLDKAMREGVGDIRLSAEQHAVLSKVLTDQHAILTRGATGTKLAAHEMANLTYQIQDTFVSLAGGQNPFLVLMQQGPQATSAVGGVERALALLMTPTAMAVGAVAALAGALGLAVYGASRFTDEFRAIERVAALTGNAAGVTAGQIVGMSDVLAEGAHVSRSTAREIQTAYVATGKIGGQMLVALTEQTRNWALSTNQETEKAAEQLAGLFADPAKAADELVSKYRMLDPAQARLIKNYQAQGSLERAQQVLLDGITPRIAGATDRVSALAEAWEWASRGVSNFIDASGRGFAAKGPSVADLKAKSDRAAKDFQADPNGSNWINGAKLSTKEIAETTAQTYAEAFRQAEADSWFVAIKAGDADVKSLQKSVQDFAAQVDPAAGAAQSFTNRQVELDRAVRTGATSQSEATRLLGLYKAQLLDVMSPMQAFAAEAERQGRVVQAQAGVMRDYESARQAELKKRGLKPADALPQRVEDGLYDSTLSLSQDKAVDQHRTMVQATDDARLLAAATASTAPAALVAAHGRVAYNQTLRATKDVTLAEQAQNDALAKGYAELSGQLGAQVTQLGLQADASERSAAAAGNGEAAMRRAGIESAVAAGEIKGLGLETRMFQEMQEAAARDQAHNDFAGQIDLEVAANRRLVEAMDQGVTARRDAEIANKAFAQTLREIPYPKAGESLDEWTQRITANIAKLKEQREAADGVDLKKYITQLQDARRGLDFQASTIGLSEEAKALAKAEHDALEYSRQQFGEYAKLSTEKKKQTDEAVSAAKENARLTSEIKRQEDAYQAVGQSIDNAVVRPLESVVDALVKGQAETLKWGDILKGVAASLAGDALKLGVVNPAKNALGFGQNASLWDLPTFGGAQQQTVRNADGSTSFAPAAQGVGGSWLSQPVFPERNAQSLFDAGQSGRWKNGQWESGQNQGWFGSLGSESPNWGQVIAGVGGIAAGVATATAKGATTGQKVGGGLMGVGGAAMMIPGGQIVGGVMMAAGALLSAITGAKDRGAAYSRSNIALGSNGKYSLGSYAADNNGNPTQFNADAIKVAKGLNDIAAKLNLTPGVTSSFIDTKEKSAEQAALELLKGMQSALPNVAYALAHETSTSLEEALQHLEFANSFDKQIAGLRSSISDLFSQFQTGVDAANTFGKSLLDVIDNGSTVFKVAAGATLPGFATGTLSAPSGWAIVGEEGPEVVRLAGGERIWNARESAQLVERLGQGRDDTLIHLRGSDELSAVRRALGSPGRINPTTGLLGFDDGAAASGKGGENAAHGETNSSTAGRDSAYGGGWGDTGRGSGGALSSIADRVSDLSAAVTDTLASFAGWQASSAAATQEQTAALASVAGLSMTAVASTLSAIASTVGPSISGMIESLTGVKGTAPAVGADYGDMSSGDFSGAVGAGVGTGGTIGDQAVQAAGGGGAYRGLTAQEINATVASLSTAIKADPTLTGALIGSMRVGTDGVGGTVGELARSAVGLGGLTLTSDVQSVIDELDQAVRSLTAAGVSIPDALKQARDNAVNFGASRGFEATGATEDRRLAEIQDSFDGVGLARTRVTELNDVVKSLAAGTFDPIGKDFDVLATDLKRAAGAYTAAGQSVPDGLFAAEKQMETLGAAKKRLLDEVAGVVIETSPEQKRVEQIKGQWSATASDLVAAFAKVGIAGAELTATLGAGLANALKKEQTSYSAAANTSLRKAKGEEGYDTAVTAIDGYTTALSDINALWPVGADRAKETTKAVDILGLNLTGLVKSGSITSKSLKELQAAYAGQPAVLAAVTAALGDLETAASRQTGDTIRRATASFNQVLDPSYAPVPTTASLLADAGVTAGLGTFIGDLDNFTGALAHGGAAASDARHLFGSLTRQFAAGVITGDEYNALVQAIGQSWQTATQKAAEQAKASEDLTVRSLRAQAMTAQADDYAQALADQRDLAQAAADGMGAAYIAGLRWVQGVEAATRATERAALVQERSAALSSRIYTLLGNTRAASYVDYQVKAGQEMRDAQSQGWSASQIATLQAVQYAESWQISANGAKQMLLTEIDRQATALQANNTALQANSGHLLELRATLRDTADSTKLNKDLTILTPEEQLAEARRQFGAALSTYNDASQTDDARYAAGQKLSGLGQSLIGASKAWNPVDNTDWNHVMDVWTNIGGVSDDELATAQKTLDANNKQITELQKLREKYADYGERQVAGIATLIDATERSYAEFNRALTALGGAATTPTTGTGGVVAPAKGGSSAERASAAGAWMKDWFGRYDALVADQGAGRLTDDQVYAAGSSLWKEKVDKANALPLDADVWKAVISAARGAASGSGTADWLVQVAHDKHVPGFATGTAWAPPGLAWVGEAGPELVHLPGGTQVYSAGASAGLVRQQAANGPWGGNVVSFRRPAPPTVERPNDGWREVVTAVTNLSAKMDNVLSILVVGGDRSHGDLVTVADEVRGVVRAVSGGGYRR